MIDLHAYKCACDLVLAETRKRLKKPIFDAYIDITLELEIERRRFSRAETFYLLNEFNLIYNGITQRYRCLNN